MVIVTCERCGSDLRRGLRFCSQRCRIASQREAALAVDIVDRLLSRVVVDKTGCWLLPATHIQGYHHINDLPRSGRTLLAHRVIWEAKHGPIPEGLELDHLCRVRNCVNPQHLEPVTHAENMRRSGPAQKRFCANGHDRFADPYFTPSGKLCCAQCIREHNRSYVRKPLRPDAQYTCECGRKFNTGSGLAVHIGRMANPSSPTHRRAGGPSPLDNVSAAVGGS